MARLRFMTMGALVLVLGALAEPIAAALALAAWHVCVDASAGAPGSGASGAAATDAVLSQLVEAFALLGCAALLAWTGLALIVSASSALMVDIERRSTDPTPDRRTPVAAAVAPALLRRTVALLMGVATAVTVGSTQSAWADSSGPTTRAVAAAPAASGGHEDAAPLALAPAALTPDRPAAHEDGWRPDRPTVVQSKRQVAAAALATGGVRRVGRDADEWVTVRRGDTLWSIAARHLQATGAPHRAGDIAREWPRWWHANLTALGGNPDLLRPGQQLRPPV